MTGLKFEKAHFILSTKEKLPIRHTAVPGIFMLISCVYIVFILYLSCVTQINVIPRTWIFMPHSGQGYVCFF